MSFLKNHIEKILGGIFTVYSVLIYFFASDEGTRLLLVLFKKECSPEAISTFQTKWVLWFFVGYGINAIFLFFAQIWTHKKITDLEDNINTKDTIIEKQRKLLTDYCNLKQHLDLIFKHHLISIYQSLSCTSTERISLYIVKNNQFIRCARYSQNPSYNKPGRAAYPINQGVIGKAWESSIFFAHDLPDYEKRKEQYFDDSFSKFGISKNEAMAFNMHSRLYLGYRISDKEEVNYNGVIILESIRPRFRSQNEIVAVLSRNRECLFKLIRDFQDSLGTSQEDYEFLNQVR